MATLTQTGITQSRGVSGRAVLERVLQTLWVWSFRMQSRHRLNELDGHLLRDIGMDTRTAMREADKPFWIA